MAKAVNRAAQLWQNWTAQQQMLESVLGRALKAEDVRKQEFEFLKAGIYRLSAQPSPDERLLLGLLQRHTDRLARQLYPNPVIRALVKLKEVLLDRPLLISRQRKLEAHNLAELSGSLNRLGFRSPALDLGRHLDFERPKVTIALGAQLNNQLNYETVLHLDKDSSGRYQLDGFTGTVKDPALPAEARSFRFSADSGITAQEAVNLLQGRAVRKDDQWLKLDLELKDASGQYPMKVFDRDYGFELKKEMEILGVHLCQPGLTAGPLIKALEAGKQVSVDVGKTPYLIEADPGRKALSIRDTAGKILPLETLAKKLRQQEKVPGLDKVKSIRAGKEQQQDRSLMVG